MDVAQRKVTNHIYQEHLRFVCFPDCSNVINFSSSSGLLLRLAVFNKYILILNINVWKKNQANLHSSLFNFLYTAAHTCSLSPKRGATCGPAVTRWYYHSSSRTCQTFSFSGCDGNSNNFATQQDCKDYCRVESCPDGGEVNSCQNFFRYL